MASSSTAVVAYGNPVDTTRCMHCRARSYSSTLMESHRQDRSSSNNISGRFSSSSLPSMAASCSSAETQESEGYFSFQSVGLLEPEEGRIDSTQEYSRDEKYKDGRSRKSQQQHVTQSSKKLHVRHASRSNSLSRLFSAFASSSSSSGSTMPLQKKKSPRTRAAHPFSSTASSPSTPVIFESSIVPKRPSLLDTVKMKSDPYIETERLKCERQHRSYYEKRCEMGFLVNAETSLRDVKSRDYRAYA